MITIHLGRTGDYIAATRSRKLEARLFHRVWPLKTISLFLAAALALGLMLLAGGCAQTSTAMSLPTDTPTLSENSTFETAVHRPPTAQTLFAMARILEIQGRDAQASLVLNEIVQHHPEFLPAYCDLSDLQVRHRQIGLAIHILNAGLKVAPHNAVLLNDRGMCHLLKKQYPQALKDFTLATACQPANTRYRCNLALALGLMGQYKQSLAVYLLILSPTDAHYNLAVICDARHDKAQAARQFALAKNLASADESD